MDKYEYKVRADEIRDLISKKKFVQAAEIADTIDWTRVKKSAILCTISDLYKKVRRFDDAIELLQLAYEKYPGGKDICYALCELYIKTNNIIKAVATYKEFLQVASTDSRRYILQYKIYEMQDISLEERIEVLEELKSRDYREKWAYTLAYLYHRVGLATKCVDECDELILWFDEGKYVYMAMELKMRHQPLTPAQQEKYDRRFEVLGGGYENYAPAEGQEYYAENQQSEQGYTPEQGNVTEQNYVTEQGYASEQGNQEVNVPETVYSQSVPGSDMEKAALAGQTVIYNPVGSGNAANMMVPDGNTVVSNGARGAVTSAEAIALSMGYTQVYHGMQPEPEIEVKQIDVGEYNTINLQQALAEGVAEVLEKNDGQASSIESIFKADTKEIYPPAPVSEGGAASQEVEYVPQSVTDKTVVIAKVTGSFDATKTIPFHDIQKEIKSMETGNDGESIPAIPVPSDNSSGAVTEAPAEQAVYTGNTVPLYNNNDIINSIKMPVNNLGPTRVVYPDNSQVFVDTMSAEAALYPTAAEAMSAQPPEQLAEVMTQEPDGQLSLVMPEDRVKLVSQITGQLSINDVMAEWNRMKYEREELNRKKYHELVKQQTGEIFNEFERAALNGVLETLEKESAEAARVKEAERLAEEGNKASEGSVQKLKFEQVERQQEAPIDDASVQKLSYDNVDMSVAENEVDGEITVADELAGIAVADASVVAEAMYGVSSEVVATGAEVAGAPLVGAEINGVPLAEADAPGIILLDALDENVTGEAVAGEATIDESVSEEVITEATAEEEIVSAEPVTKESAAEDNSLTEESYADVEPAKSNSFEENIGEIFDKIEEEEAEDGEDFSSIWSKSETSEAYEDNLEAGEQAQAENEFIENAEGDETEVAENYENAATDEEPEVNENNYDDNEYDNEGDNEEAEDNADPREKSYHVIGMNETTTRYINKKKKKDAEKAAKDAEGAESDEDDSDDVRELTPEENELFGPYVQSKESRKQLINVIDNVSMASYTGNIIITGDDGTDVSDLATVIMKDIKQTDSNFSGKVARVPAAKLNNKKMEVVVKQLANGALIIENASAMSDNVASSICKCLDQENLGIIITMLDTERNMDKLLSRVPRLSPLFTARMNVKPMTKEQLAEYAVKYALEQEFSIDQMGMLALHRQIDARQTATHSVNVIEVREIVDNAISHVKKKTIGHFFDILGGKRYDSEDMIILSEKDFR